MLLRLVRTLGCVVAFDSLKQSRSETLSESNPMMWLILSLSAATVVLAWLLHNWLRQWLGDTYAEIRPQLEWGLSIALSLITLYSLWSWTRLEPRGDLSLILGSILSLLLLSIIAVGSRNIRKP